MLRATGLGAEVQQTALDHARQQQQRAAGLEVRDGMGYATAPGLTDVSRLPPVAQPVTPQQAEMEAATIRELAGQDLNGRPAAHRPVPAMPSSIIDVSGTPGTWLDTR